MSVSTDFLKARHVGVRDFKSHLSKIYLNRVLVITDRGNPISVNVPYEELLELVDMLDEMSDAETSKTVEEGRKAIRAGAKGVPVSEIFKKVRARHKK